MFYPVLGKVKEEKFLQADEILYTLYSVVGQGQKCEVFTTVQILNLFYSILIKNQWEK